MPALTAEQEQSATGTRPAAAETREQRLDRLFSELKRERNDKAAQRIADRIWQEWYRSGSASIDLLMQWSGKAVADKKYDAALDFLDQVTLLQPGFAEGWNRRATVHFLMHDYGKSMADIEKTLELEPRHFGAICGFGQICLRHGETAAAAGVFAAALEVNPHLDSVRAMLTELEPDPPRRLN